VVLNPVYVCSLAPAGGRGAGSSTTGKSGDEGEIGLEGRVEGVCGGPSCRGDAEMSSVIGSSLSFEATEVLEGDVGSVCSAGGCCVAGRAGCGAS
jgi:hypothetical protein